MEKRNPLIKTFLCILLSLLMIGCGAAPEAIVWMAPIVI